MPCNYSGFFDAGQAAQYGIVDFDWSNAKAMWTAQHPMDCEERLVQQAQMVKAINANTKVYIYRNLVKALPWYSHVRTKLLDSSFGGWFLPFKPGGSLPNGSYHVPRCTLSVLGGPKKCSNFYHDQDQTPQGSLPPPPPPPNTSGWGIVKPGKIPKSGPDNSSVWLVYQTTMADTYQHCADAAAKAVSPSGGNITDAHYFTWWGHFDQPKLAVYRCWLSSKEGWEHSYTPVSKSVLGIVSGFRGVPRPKPPVPWGDGLCPGDCDCGEGVPCGEYLWDHRNQSLRRYLIEHAILSNSTGLGNPNIDGFYFDDDWSNTSNPPRRGDPGYHFCDSSRFGGPSEEDFDCVLDMGLTQNDTTSITTALHETMTQVNAAILQNGGFSTRMMVSYAVHAIDNAALDPRPPSQCISFMRKYCQPNNPNLRQAFIYE